LASASITFRTDDEIKRQASAVFAKLGMDMSTGMNVFLRAIVQEQGFPFSITLNSMSLEERRELTKTLRKRLAIIERGDPKDFVSHAEVERMMGL